MVDSSQDPVSSYVTESCMERLTDSQEVCRLKQQAAGDFAILKPVSPATNYDPRSDSDAYGAKSELSLHGSAATCVPSKIRPQLLNDDPWCPTPIAVLSTTNEIYDAGSDDTSKLEVASGNVDNVANSAAVSSPVFNVNQEKSSPRPEDIVNLPDQQRQRGKKGSARSKARALQWRMRAQDPRSKDTTGVTVTY
jgi:hypothetical protein